MNESPNPPKDISPRRFRAGVFCIILNYILGWPLLLGIESLALYLESKTLAVVGTAIYGFSWVLLGLGLWLAGPEVVTYVKEKFGRGSKTQASDD